MIKDNIIVYVGGQPLTIGDFGPAADMRLDQAFQYLVDSGKIGQYPVGTKWWEVFRPGCFETIPPAPEGETLLEKLREEFVNCEKALLKKSNVTDADKDELADKLSRYKMAMKLSKGA